MRVKIGFLLPYSSEMLSKEILTFSEKIPVSFVCYCSQKTKKANLKICQISFVLQ